MKKVPKDHVSARQAALLLGVDDNSIKNWVKSGRIPAKIKRVREVRVRYYIRKCALGSRFKGNRAIVSANKAAELLKVSPDSIKKWVKQGRILGEIKKTRFTREYMFIPKSALGGALVAECAWCHKRFVSKRPSRGKFCCTRHKNYYFWERRRTSKKPYRPREK